MLLGCLPSLVRDARSEKLAGLSECKSFYWPFRSARPRGSHHKSRRGFSNLNGLFLSTGASQPRTRVANCAELGGNNRPRGQYDSFGCAALVNQHSEVWDMTRPMLRNCEPGNRSSLTSEGSENRVRSYDRWSQQWLRALDEGFNGQPQPVCNDSPELECGNHTDTLTGLQNSVKSNHSYEYGSGAFPAVFLPVCR